MQILPQISSKGQENVLLLHMIKKIILGILALILIPILAFGALVAYLSITDYKPEQIEIVEIHKGSKLASSDSLDLISWNIGYAGLGKEMDFFMDNGTGGWPSKTQVEGYLSGAADFISSSDADVYFLQEVDKKAKRSYGLDEVSAIATVMPDYDWVFAKNYDVRFVPVPISAPMGGVLAGQMNLSKYKLAEPAERHALPGQYDFLTQLAQLDRAALLTRVKASDGKDWVLINTHNSAFDKGELRTQQLEYLKNLMVQEYAKGNYVIVGGDWNLALPGVTYDQFPAKGKAYDGFLEFPTDWTPSGWQWAVDPNTPTNRTVSQPYIEGDNYTTVIDGFVVSPNLEIVSVQGVDLGFKDADHNPVRLKVQLRK